RPSLASSVVSSGPAALSLRRLPAWLDPVFDLLFPAICPVCQSRSDDPPHRPFCASCWANLPLLAAPGCRVCRRAVARPPPALACDPCRREPPPYDRVRAVAAYRNGMRTAIHALKYGRRTALAAPLAALLAEYGERLLDTVGPAGAGFDAVVPVPLH